MGQYKSYWDHQSLTTKLVKKGKKKILFSQYVFYFFRLFIFSRVSMI